jgi:hypothetical protein
MQEFKCDSDQVKSFSATAGGSTCLETEWWGLKLGRVTAVREERRKVARESWPAMSHSLKIYWASWAKRAHVVHCQWAFCHPCWQSPLPPQSSQSAFLFLPPLTPRHVLQKPDALGHSLHCCLCLPRKMPWHRAAGGHERKSAGRRAVATHLPCTQMPDALGHSLHCCLCLPRKMPWHRAAGGHERKSAGERWPLTCRARRRTIRRTLCSIAAACHAKCHGTGPPAGTSEKAPASGGHSLAVHAF